MSILSTIPRRSGLAGPGCPIAIPTTANCCLSGSKSRSMPSQPAPSVGIRWSAVRSDFNRRGIKPSGAAIKPCQAPMALEACIIPACLRKSSAATARTNSPGSAAPLFKRMDVPSLDVWMPLFWDISVQAGFATPLDTWGIPHDVWRLRLPEPGIFLPLLEQHLPELSSLAEMTHAAQAA